MGHDLGGSSRWRLGGEGDITLAWLLSALGICQESDLHPARRSSFCEQKGPALYWNLLDGERCLPQVYWTCPHPLAGAEPLVDCIAFYAHHLDCTLDGKQVVAQSGGFYGGWSTPDLSGPFKETTGTSGC
ncbi:DUF427 domain-containing protein [Limnohabitans sp. Rim8]|uniref:DUF427 domain-containing protein n=1 Tax=Limnohabitans sp. Rim8 TaxID=1100718 RepID=UPI0033061C5F